MQFRIIDSNHMFTFLFLLAQTIYIALPAIAANTTPPSAAQLHVLESLNKPIDFGRTFRGKRIFGDHKTFRGYVIGIPAAIIIAGIQYFLFTRVEFFRTLLPISFDDVNWVLYGFLMGLGTLVGDSVKSFFKRQIGKKPGESWFPWDQLDSVIGAVVFTSFVVRIPWPVIVTIVFLGPVLHMLFDFIGYRTGLKEKSEVLPFLQK